MGASSGAGPSWRARPPSGARLQSRAGPPWRAGPLSLHRAGLRRPGVRGLRCFQGLHHGRDVDVDVEVDIEVEVVVEVKVDAGDGDEGRF